LGRHQVAARTKAALAAGEAAATVTADREAVRDAGADPAAPRHIAIIMDGNGRWAAARGLPRVAGHRAGAQAVRRTVESAIRHGVGWITLYAFSSENWRRPAGEVLDLTGLLRHYLRSEVEELKREGVRLRFIGDRDRFDADIVHDLADAERATAGNTRLNLTLLLSYGARAEIAAAARAAALAVRQGGLDPDTIDEISFARLLSTSAMPDPDLIIRTSGEQRLSNFLLWQSAYAELLFLDVLWPDFGPVHFAEAIADFARRERRFGARPV
jgi:undecaprenyl diphosphate synthase